LNNYEQDFLGNKLAMEYAHYLLREKENETILNSLAHKLHYPGVFKLSTFNVFVDVSDDNGGKKGRFMDYVHEFTDAHSALVEFESDRANLLSSTFNSVSIGMAFDEEKVVVVDLFSTRELTIESCNINEDMGSIIVKGHMLNENFGVYAMKIVSEENVNKSLMLINPSNIISPDLRPRPFTASFVGAAHIIKDTTPKLIEVYIRERPSTIKYNQTFTDNIGKFEQDLKFLKVGLRFGLENFPSDIVIREQKKEEEEEKRRLAEEESRKQEEKIKEREEKEFRIRKIDSDGVGV
jgi:KaiC/GvpD/RAD55 family RecA-like ATPase